MQFKVTIFNAMFALFLFVGLYLKKSFFKYIFEKTFHYAEGLGPVHLGFRQRFFVATAVADEVVRISYAPGNATARCSATMDGVNVWILFKVAIIMPASGYAWLLTRIMAKHALPIPDRKDVVAAAASGVPVAHKKPATDATPAG